MSASCDCEIFALPRAALCLSSLRREKQRASLAAEAALPASWRVLTTWPSTLMETFSSRTSTTTASRSSQLMDCFSSASAPVVNIFGHKLIHPNHQPIRRRQWSVPWSDWPNSGQSGQHNRGRRLFKLQEKNQALALICQS